MTKDNIELTRAELEVMQIIWEKETPFMSEIYEAFPEGDNRPAYTTIATFVRIMERKGFVGHKAYGKAHRYFPLISKNEYTSRFMKSVIHNFFDNSPSQLLSFFADNGDLTTSQFEELRRIAKKITDKK